MSAFRLILFRIFFFLSGFSFTDTEKSQDSRRRERTIYYSTLPLPPAHEHSDICNFASEITRWDLPPYWITIWLIDDVMVIFVCLLVDLILGFATAIRHEKPVYLNLHWLSSLYYKRTDQPRVNRLFPRSDWIWTRITWNTDTFHAVIIVQLHNGVSDTTWYYGRWNTVFRCSFKIQPNIYDGVFLGK